MEDVRLTTKDNPYNPFTDFPEWYAFDTAHGYNTSAYLARIAEVSDGLSEALNAQAVEEAIDEIIRLDPFGIYKKVTLA